MKSLVTRLFTISIVLGVSICDLFSQTRLEPGDLAIIQVNANNAQCSGEPVDRIAFICFKDITAGTTIDITDNAWERTRVGRWGNSEGFVRATRSGNTIPAGTVIYFEFPAVGNNNYRAILPDDSWTFTAQGSINTANLNSGGDQFFFMQGGTWNQGSSGVGNFNHDASYTGGRILFGFNTKTQWLNNDSSQDSKLHPEVATCFNMAPTNNATDFIAYTGLQTATTQLEWVSRIANPNNWTTAATCNALPPVPLRLGIDSTRIQLRCTTCSGCDTINEVLRLTLPSTGGPFVLRYSDGLDTFTLNQARNNDSIRISVGETTTFFIVSVTDANGCPIFSNFGRPSTVTITQGVRIQPIIDPVTACADNNQQATFALTALEGQLRGNTALVVRWFRDLNMRDTIVNPDQFVTGPTTVFAITTDGVCSSQATPVVLQLATPPSASIPAGDTTCGGTCARLPLVFRGKAPFILGYIINEGGMIRPDGLVATTDRDTLVFCPSRNGQANLLFSSLIDGSGCPTLINQSANVVSQGTDTIVLRRSLCQGEQLIVNGQVYDQNRPRGLEFLRSRAGCDSIVSIDLRFAPRPDGSMTGDTTICGGGEGRLRFQLSGGNRFNLRLTNGRDTIPFNNVTNGSVLPVILTNTTTFTLVSVRLVGGTCESRPNAVTTITISEPSATAQATTNFGRFNISCNGANDGAATVNVRGGKAPFRYAWSNNASTQSINNLAPGNYSVIVTDSAGCQALPASVSLTQPDSLRFQFTLDTSVCPGKDNQLRLINVTGAGGPYAFALDGATFTPFNGPLTISKLLPGDRVLRISDGNNCITQRNIRIPASSELRLELGADRQIFAGDSVLIKPQLNFNPSSVSWQPGTGFQSLDSATIVARPTTTTVYQLVVRSGNGCTLRDNLTVVVEKRLRIFAPNVFSPNGDSQNDYFHIFYAPEVERISYLRIFDRWGALVFEVENPGKEETSGWDGTIKGQFAPVGVYVFVAEAVLRSGSKEMVRGSVTLLR